MKRRLFFNRGQPGDILYKAAIRRLTFLQLGQTPGVAPLAGW
ncbi:MAG: hypothetical protein U0401_06130 [Anaerolineae bacterium]